MNDSKKGLNIVYDPHNLYQFIWYYCHGGNDLEWDALCLPNDRKGEYMHSYCEASGIFKNVIKDDKNFNTLPTKEKLKVFLGMLGHLIIGKRRQYCKKMLNQYVNIDDYDRIVVLTGVGIVSGACIALSKEKDIVILEDGVGDYSERKKWIKPKNLKSVYHWQGFILSHMGYSCPGWYYFAPEKYCLKFSSRPDKMPANIYREIRQLYEEEGTDQELLKTLIERTYPQIAEIDFSKYQTIFLTLPLVDCVHNTAPYQERLQKFFAERYTSIILKKHPRDLMEYDFGEKAEVFEIPSSIPAEAIMTYIKDMDIYMCESCSTIMYAKPYGLKCMVIILDGYYEESISEGVEFSAPSEESILSYIREFGSEDCVTVKV